MKTRKNKKFYNFTDKQKKRDRSRKMPRCWIHWTPAHVRRSENRKRKAVAKQILIKLLSGREVEFIRYRNDIIWRYW